MYKRLGAAVIAVLLLLHSLLGFGAGSAWAAEPQTGIHTSAEAGTENPTEEKRTERQGEAAKETDASAAGSAQLAETPPQLQSAEENRTDLAEVSDEKAQPGLSVGESVYGAPQPSNILTSVSVTDDEGNAVGDGSSSDMRIDPGEALNLHYQWALPNDHTYKDGSTFEFDLPKAFRIYTEISDVALTTGGDGNESAGSFSVDTDGHVTVVFNRFVEDHSNVSGTITVRSELKEEIVRESTEVRIPFAIGESEQVFVLYLKPNKGALLEKKGEADNAAGLIRWTLDLNTSLQKLDSVSLNDPIPDGLTLNPQSVSVYKLGVSTSGERTQGGETGCGTVYAERRRFFGLEAFF